MTAFDRQAFDDVCTKSGLTMSEIAGIYGITRQTVYNWRRGVTPTQGIISRVAAAYTAGLYAAIRKGVLPMAPDTAREVRAHRIRRMAVALHQAAQKTIGA